MLTIPLDRVCAAGQGIVFTILAPKPGIFFCKDAPKRVYTFQIFAPRQGYDGNFAPLLPDRLWFFPILLPDWGI